MNNNKADKSPIVCLLLICFLLTGSQGMCQQDSLKNPTGYSQLVPEPGPTVENEIGALNILKTNITGIILKNYSLQYERVIDKKFSLLLQYRFMPETGLPFKHAIMKWATDNSNADTKKLIEEFRMSNFALAPEIRWYTGKKGYGTGFYVSLFYRYATYTSNHLNIFYTDDQDVQQSIGLDGKLTSNTGGILLGWQHFWKHIGMDVWIFGPQYGGATGTFNGLSSRILNKDEQQNVRDQLNNIDLPLTRITIYVDENSASLQLHGPWAGLRIGLSFAVRL